MIDWDQTHEWIIDRFYNDLTKVAIQFRQLSPSVAELATIRKCLPQFRDMSPAMVRSALGDSGILPLGVMPTREARELIEMVQAQGLQALAENVSFVSYLPFDRTTGCAWLIEDNAMAASVAYAMLAAGVPVRDVEA